MTLFSSNPFERLLQLQRELDRALDAPMLGFEGTRSVFPPLNIFGERDGIVIRAEVPGFTSEQIAVTVEPRTLVLKGERPADEDAPASYHRRERPYGSFARSVALPKDLDTSKASAEYRNGLLTIRIPKAEAAKPRQITIQNAA
jgi:HSP20 family protein